MINKISNEELLNEINKRFQEREITIKESKQMLKEMEQMNKKLEKAEENRSKFMSIIKNEFNNPLYSIISLSKSLLKTNEKIVQNENIEIIGSSIEEESLFLNFQIRNIITAAEIESGTLDTQFSTFFFTDLIEEVKEELKYPLTKKKIELKINIVETEKGSYDRDKIFLILLNLVSNAVEFSPKNSKVELDIIEDLEDLRIIIKDNGEGIKDSDIENIFKRFEQCHSGKNRIQRGQGLGLSIIADLVDFLEGKMELKSKLNEYTIVEIKIKKGSNEEDLFDEDFMFDFSEDSEGF